MKAIIIEDELPSARRLERLLQGFEIEIIYKLNAVKSSVLWFQKNEHPDINFFRRAVIRWFMSFEIFEESRGKVRLNNISQPLLSELLL